MSPTNVNQSGLSKSKSKKAPSQTASQLVQQTTSHLTLQAITYPHWDNPDVKTMAPFIKTFGQEFDNIEFYTKQEATLLADQDPIKPVIEPPVINQTEAVSTQPLAKSEEPEAPQQIPPIINEEPTVITSSDEDKIVSAAPETISEPEVILEPPTQSALIPISQPEPLLSTPALKSDLKPAWSYFNNYWIMAIVTFFLTIISLIGITLIALKYQENPQWISELNYQVVISALAISSSLSFVLNCYYQIRSCQLIKQYQDHSDWIDAGIKKRRSPIIISPIPFFGLFSNGSYSLYLKKLIGVENVINNHQIVNLEPIVHNQPSSPDLAKSDLPPVANENDNK